MILVGGLFVFELSRGAPSDHGFSLAGRRCTDPLCALLFFLSLCAMVAATMSALGTADPRRLTHGLDYRGELCGVDPSVLDSPVVLEHGQLS